MHRRTDEKEARPDSHHQSRREYDLLAQLDEAAIRRLGNQLFPIIKSLPGVHLFSAEDIEELRNDALLITLQKITTGQFKFQEHSPLGYAAGVARKLMANKGRKKKLATIPIEKDNIPTDLDPEQYYLAKEYQQTIGRLLDRLGGRCAQLIRLKYYDNLRDQEILDRKLTAYTSLDSLKSKRSQCLKKLLRLINETGMEKTDLLP